MLLTIPLPSHRPSGTAPPSLRHPVSSLQLLLLLPHRRQVGAILQQRGAGGLTGTCGRLGCRGGRMRGGVSGGGEGVRRPTRAPCLSTMLPARPPQRLRLLRLRLLLLALALPRLEARHGLCVRCCEGGACPALVRPPRGDERRRACPLRRRCCASARGLPPAPIHDRSCQRDRCAAAAPAGV